ncbi:hypothetical protein QOT17_011140 [Balamuthia mandrillaris]
MTKETDKLFDWIDISSLQIALDSFLPDLPDLDFTIPIGELGPIGEFIGDIGISVPVEDVLRTAMFPSTPLNSILAYRGGNKNLFLHKMLSSNGELCAVIARSVCDNTVELKLTQGEDIIYSLPLQLGAFTRCKNEIETSVARGPLSLKLKFNFEERTFSICIQILEGVVLPHDLCFNLADIVWTMEGFSFCPNFHLTTPFNDDKIELSCITFGKVDDCNRIRAFKECEETEGCGWCPARRYCQSTTNKPSAACEQCPSWNYENQEDGTERRQEGTSTPGLNSIPFIDSLRKKNKQQADRIEEVFCGDWHRYSDTDTATLSKETWMKSMQRWLRKPGQLEKAWNELDKNGDGLITYIEFCSVSALGAKHVDLEYGGLKEDDDEDDSEDKVVAGIVVSTLLAATLLVVLMAVGGYFGWRHRRAISLQATMRIRDLTYNLRGNNEDQSLHQDQAQGEDAEARRVPKLNLKKQQQDETGGTKGLSARVSSARRNPLELRVEAPDGISSNNPFVTRAGVFLSNDESTQGHENRLKDITKESKLVLEQLSSDEEREGGGYMGLALRVTSPRRKPLRLKVDAPDSIRSNTPFVTGASTLPKRQDDIERVPRAVVI